MAEMSSQVMKRQLWLFRHGAKEWALRGQHTGGTELQLLPEGKAEARALAPILSNQHLPGVQPVGQRAVAAAFGGGFTWAGARFADVAARKNHSAPPRGIGGGLRELGLELGLGRPPELAWHHGACPGLSQA